MTKQQIVNRFLEKPTYFDNGAGFLAKAWKCSKEEIKEAKAEARSIMKAEKQAAINNENTTYLGSDSSEEGVVKKFSSPSPLTPKEIETLAGVDGINTYVARVWEKLQADGSWTYSVDVRYRVKDFFSADELKAKLAEIMPKDLTPYTPKTLRGPSNAALVICIADDHCGAVNTSNLFEKNPLTYQDRLLRIIDEASVGTTFEEIHVISLGDQLNGWNSQTTRGGHEVTSLSNEDQFDIYVKARIAFYDTLFTSGLSDKYFLHDVENSNHAGLGMSYMANRALELYVEARYPTVVRESVRDMIGGFDYGKHVVFFGHGKDEKLQKRPMPYNLDAKTDLFLYDYAQRSGYSPSDENITFYKGDLHQNGMQRGKFGRYINVPAISGASDYGDINFGFCRAGALMEILEKDSYRILSQSIWF